MNESQLEGLLVDFQFFRHTLSAWK